MNSLDTFFKIAYSSPSQCKFNLKRSNLLVFPLMSANGCTSGVQWAALTLANVLHPWSATVHKFRDSRYFGNFFMDPSYIGFLGKRISWLFITITELNSICSTYCHFYSIGTNVTYDIFANSNGQSRSAHVNLLSNVTTQAYSPSSFIHQLDVSYPQSLASECNYENTIPNILYFFIARTKIL